MGERTAGSIRTIAHMKSPSLWMLNPLEGIGAGLRGALSGKSDGYPERVTDMFIMIVFIYMSISYASEKSRFLLY